MNSENSFAENYRTLERIARQLEEGDADLDALLPLIGEATIAYSACKSRLEAVKAVLADVPAPSSLLAEVLEEEDELEEDLDEEE